VTGTYIPNDPGPNPNISDTPPWRLFAVLGAGFVLMILVLWFALGAIAGAVAQRVPDAMEARLGSLFDVERLQGQQPELLAARVHLQAMVDVMARELPERALRYRVVVLDDTTVNAAALPGGWILVFAGLIESAESENELAMVIGHELAHHVHRDHLEGLGRRLVVGAVINAIFGGTAGLDQISRLGVEGLSLRMSRDDEREADALALELLVATYGHVGGATDFFARLVDRDPSARLAWLQTHPLSIERIRRIEALAAERGYRFGATRPLPDFAILR
jgi:predicted Zn-dependent protease